MHLIYLTIFTASLKNDWSARLPGGAFAATGERAGRWAWSISEIDAPPGFLPIAVAGRFGPLGTADFLGPWWRR